MFLCEFLCMSISVLFFPPSPSSLSFSLSLSLSLSPFHFVSLLLSPTLYLSLSLSINFYISHPFCLSQLLPSISVYLYLSMYVSLSFSICLSFYLSMLLTLVYSGCLTFPLLLSHPSFFIWLFILFRDLTTYLTSTYIYTYDLVEVVNVSQVLPGYAPSYASDYIPAEVIISMQKSSFPRVCAGAATGVTL